uniref:p53 and DNA damage-regulated protein 1 n=2 Tax=Lutzomyia longipalpis TaxID=7200 RepID=A0A1B0GLE5_LUTLO
MPRKKAEELLVKDQEVIDSDIERLRNEQRKLVNELRDLEHLSPVKGFDMKPLARDEMSALQANLLNFSEGKIFTEKLLEKPASVPMKTDAEKTIEILEASERVADKILVNKQEIIDLDKRRQANREALRELRKSQEGKHWISVGNLLVEMPRKKAEELLVKDQEVIDSDIERLRNEQRKLVNELRDLEHLSPAKGFDMKPLARDEMSALQANLLNF